ncbi:MAG TPA: ABC transporter ATP-binding protein [Bryobacteraceae bacterium]|jgi:ATP-binding cassette subfamily B protein
MTPSGEQLGSWRQRLHALKNMPPIIKLAWSTAPGQFAAGGILRLASALVPVAMLWIGKLIIDGVVAAIKHTGPIRSDMWLLLGLEFLLALSSNFIWRTIDYFDVRLTDQFTREISLRIMAHAARLDVQSFEDPVFYDKLERARVQATDRTAMLRSLGQLLQQAVTFATMAAAIIAYSPILLLVIVASVVPSFLCESYFAFQGYDLAHQLTPVRRQMDYLRLLGSSKESAKELRVFGLGHYLHQQFDKLSGDVIARNKTLGQRRLRWCFVFGIAGSIGYYVCYALLVFRALRGQIGVGDLTFLAGTLAACSTQIQSLFSTFSGIADQTLFLGDLLDFFEVKPKIVSRPMAFPAPRPIRDGFEFRNVSFHYPGSSRLILNNLSLRMAAGERIALVGENGQGKTTFVKLLTRLYDPTSGSIFLDGVDLRDYNVEDLHREVGVIFQDFMRYDMTARENIGVGRIENLPDDGALRYAARQSRADEVLVKLPRDLDQMLGRRFEGGVDLSGGEWQKFAIARAYLRDAQLLILDEPTAALDAAAELQVFERFAELTEGRTVLLISHRFSTVRIADRIVVIEGGRVSEQGTHRQLIDCGGRYARLFEMQAANYR